MERVSLDARRSVRRSRRAAPASSCRAQSSTLSGLRHSRGSTRLCPNMRLRVGARGACVPCSSCKNRSPSTLPQIARACFGARCQSPTKSVTPAAASRVIIPSPTPGNLVNFRSASASGSIPKSNKSVPFGLCRSAAIFAKSSVGAIPIEHVNTGLNSRAKAALILAASVKHCRASLGNNAQTTSSIDLTSWIGTTVSITSRMRLCNRT